MLCGLSNGLNENIYDRYWYNEHFSRSKRIINEYTEMLGYQWIFQTILIVLLFFPLFGLPVALITYFVIYLEHAETTATAMLEVTKTLLGASKL